MNRKNSRLLAVGLVLLLVTGITAFLILTSGNQPSSDVIRVACVGDSLTQSTKYTLELWRLLGSGAPYTMGNYTINPEGDGTATNSTARYAVSNFGVGSTTVLLNTETPYMNTSTFQNSLKFQPNIVIIMLGTNDAQPNLEIYNASFVGDYVKLINAFQALASKPKIWVVLPPPIFSNQSGKIDPEYFKLTVIPSIERAANETNSPTINVYSALANYPNYFPDGVHPNNAGAELIANEVYKTIIP